MPKNIDHFLHMILADFGENASYINCPTRMLFLVLSKIFNVKAHGGEFRFVWRNTLISNKEGRTF